MRDVSVSKSRCAVVVRRECVEKSRWGFRDLVGCVKLTQPFFFQLRLSRSRGEGEPGTCESGMAESESNWVEKRQVVG